jgi:RNA 3'-terminal phosphate cyclase
MQTIDEFIIIIDNAINDGNVDILVKAITHYQNSIPINYINSAKIILYELLIEKMECTHIN